MGGLIFRSFKDMANQRLFLVGLVFKLILISYVNPYAVDVWYAPFMETSIDVFNIDPWYQWAVYGGDIKAFPYGYSMWIIFLPLFLILDIFSVPGHYAYMFTILIIDIYLLILLRALVAPKMKILLFAYWLSPIVILSAYILGLNDLVPILLLTLSLYYLKNNNFFTSGFWIISAISAKFSMIIAFPFFIIYLLNNKSMRQMLPSFMKGAFIAFACLILPFAFSDDGIQTLISNPEMTKILDLKYSQGSGKNIYLIPLLYCVFLYFIWRMKRINFDLFYAVLGISFLMTVLVTPASPGWFVWAVPLLVRYQTVSDKTSVYLIGAFSILYVIINFPQEDVILVFDDLYSLLYTAIVAIGFVLSVRIWREVIRQNDYFRLSRKPFVLGVAGKSDFEFSIVSNFVHGLFGKHSISSLSEGSYCLWGLKKPMWKVLTRFNPRANDLEGFSNDLISLSNGKNIEIGGAVISSNDFILATGPHVIYLPILRECIDLNIFLNMRDIVDGGPNYHKSNHEAVMKNGLTVDEQRQFDINKFVNNQEPYADLSFVLEPTHRNLTNEYKDIKTSKMKLTAKSRLKLNELSLVRVLISVCGLHVEVDEYVNMSESKLVIEGEVSSEDIAIAAKMICPLIIDFLDICPIWSEGVVGVMQLIVLTHIEHVLSKRHL